jgi:hypothetical protein
MQAARAPRTTDDPRIEPKHTVDSRIFTLTGHSRLNDYTRNRDSYPTLLGSLLGTHQKDM